MPLVPSSLQAGVCGFCLEQLGLHLADRPALPPPEAPTLPLQLLLALGTCVPVANAPVTPVLLEGFCCTGLQLGLAYRCPLPYFLLAGPSSEDTRTPLMPSSGFGECLLSNDWPSQCFQISPTSSSRKADDEAPVLAWCPPCILQGPVRMDPEGRY